MATILNPDVGRIWLPDKTMFGAAGRFEHGSRHRAVISYRVRDSKGLVTQRGWGVGRVLVEGLHRRWAESDELQQLFATPALFVACVRARLLGRGDAPVHGMAFAHNERIQNGARMEGKSFWGLATSPQVSTVNTPSFMALNNNSSFTSGNFTYVHCGTDLSLGNGATPTAAGITTNEFTAHGLARASATVGSYVDASALDGVFTFTVTHTFTESSGPDTVYGLGLFDASSTATCNLFMEGPFSSATLNSSDTLACTVNGSS